MNILIVSCSLDPESRSRVLARQAEQALLKGTAPAGPGAGGETVSVQDTKADQAAQAEPMNLTFVDLRDYPLPLCDGDTAYAHPNVKALNDILTPADAILLAVPIYTYDVNAAAKNLVELTGRAWEDKVAGFLCAAGGRSSYMSVMAFASSLMLDFRTLIVPRFVYAVGADFGKDAEGNDVIADEKVRERVGQLAHELRDLGRVKRHLRHVIEGKN